MLLRVLLYTGEGANPDCRADLKSLLTGYLTRRCSGDQSRRDNFAIDETAGGREFKDPSVLSAYKLVAFPGGFDLGFIRCLGESGMSNLRWHVQSGGCGYLGICAGAYFACGRIEFAAGDPQLEVLGSRLGLYGGLAVGPVFPGFAYQSDAGARAAEVQDVGTGVKVRMYFNGGPKFVAPDTTGVTNDGSWSSSRSRCLAVYTEPGGAGQAAVVLSQCGAGAALLFGVHPEIAKLELEKSSDARLRGIFLQLKESAEDRLRATYSMLDALMDLIGL